jgi:cholesterol oxidase
VLRLGEVSVPVTVLEPGIEWKTAPDRDAFPRRRDAQIAAAIHARAKRIAGRAGILVDTNRLNNTTWHPLGGVPMGTACDLDGRVRGHRGLYVLDGALIPGSTAACNPSMTIAAVVERALERIVRHDIGSVL